MKRQMIIAALILAALLPPLASADIYRWKDANGVINFSNTPPPPGTTIIEKTEETPYDAEIDRRRIEEDRRLQLERQKLELEERKADMAAREREAQMKLDEAERRVQEAQELEQSDLEQDDDCDDDYYFRHGSCGYSVYGYRYYRGRPGSPDLYRGVYRDNNSLYYKDPPRLKKHPPARSPQRPSRVRPAPKSGDPQNTSKTGRAPAAAEEPVVK